MSTLIVNHPFPVVRRSENYEPCIWDDDFVQTLATDYTKERFNGRVNELKGNVIEMLNDVAKPNLDQLELIDNLQRLGLGYHFEKEIKSALMKIYEDQSSETLKRNDLHAAALRFRLLRQHGYDISQDVFEYFMVDGSFKGCLCEDAKGVLSLYEAYYFSSEGESIMEAAWSFTSKTLTEILDNITDPNLSIKVRHALELPLNWRMPRLEARWYIDFYARSNNMNPALLELAKLDYNILQGLYQKELKIASRWWKELDVSTTLSFARDRLVESFIWMVGIIPQPQFGYCRIEVAKAIQMISVIDDIYDIYGTVHELELFTDAIERWDINSVQLLPDYMRICFLALYNMVNETVHYIYREQNVDVLPNLKKVWIDLVKCYLVEARWYHSGYTPTLEEYLENGKLSIALPSVATQSYIFSANPIEKEALGFLEDMPDILHSLGTLCRIVDDYGTSSDEIARGDVPKSIQCHMFHNGTSEEAARAEMRALMRKKWREINACRGRDMPLSSPNIETMLNVGRSAHYIYYDSDGYAGQDGKSKDMFLSLMVQPVPL
ncbi:(R)-limonene synthase 1, chloroplastic-like [Daucus carota subsp. sativus]|uniref:(R)-limonene synthase 1, chloroplastic-like n=1 Tax=Daucus carota subsp. sativus TaxID=79200 RepID=UPI0007EFDEA4|nr:PREDICTED: (R)-limonene synthase 1-like [Daucus carota subsp. sativus]